MSFHGSYEVVREEPRPPEIAPRECSLCGGIEPIWWLLVEAPTDAHGDYTESTVLAAWWAACDECERLVADRDQPGVESRVVPDLRVDMGMWLPRLVQRALRGDRSPPG